MTTTVGLNSGLPRSGLGRSQKTKDAGAPARRGMGGAKKQESAFVKSEMGSQTVSRDRALPSLPTPISLPLNTVLKTNTSASSLGWGSLKNLGWKVLSF